MKGNQSPITVYWTTGSFSPEEDSWSFLYQSPESLLSIIKGLKSEQPKINQLLACPAINSFIPTVYVFKHAITNTVKLPNGILTELSTRDPSNESTTLTVPVLESKLTVTSNRASSLEGYANIGYNMSWLLFSDEPLMAKFTAPFYPPTAPCDGALLSPGRFDIGSWYRPYQLDYHVPIDTLELHFKENDHLFYVEFETERPIILKRFVENKVLRQIRNETVNKYPQMFGKFRPLKTRYEDAKKAKIPEIVLSEIKKNVVE